MATEYSYFPAVRRYFERRGYTLAPQKKGVGTIGVQADIIGIRDSSYESSTVNKKTEEFTFFERPEIIAVEVETSIGTKLLTEAARLSVYAHYCYFALAEEEYNQSHIEIAESLGVGLLQIIGGPRRAHIEQIREAQRRDPREDIINRLMYSSFGYSQCSICRAYTWWRYGRSVTLYKKSEWKRKRYVETVICASCIEGLRRIITTEGIHESVNYGLVRKKMQEGSKNQGLYVRY